MWYIIYFFYSFKKDKKYDIIKNKIIKNKIINIKKSNECKISENHDKNYWPNIIQKCKDNNIFINNNIEIINYTHKDNKIFIESKENKYYNCDKLIICTANDLQLIKNVFFHKYINTISGIVIIARVKNVINCYSKINHILFSPYKNDLIKISLLNELFVDSKYNNYNIEKGSEEYKKILDYLDNNNDIKNIGIISIENIWYGVRAVTYDTIPFFTLVDKNIYWMSGGSFIGTYFAEPFSKWFVEYILYDKVNNTYLDPTINRLYKIKLECYIIFIIIILVLIICYKVVKK
jgi:hypothetical protein